MSAPQCLRAFLNARLGQDSGLVAACADRRGPGFLPRATEYPYQYWIAPPATGSLALGGGVVYREYRVQVAVTGLAVNYDAVAELAARQKRLLSDYFRPHTNDFGTVTTVQAMGQDFDTPDEDEAGKPIVRVGEVYLIGVRAFDAISAPASAPQADDADPVPPVGG